MTITTAITYTCDIAGTDTPITLVRETPIHGALTNFVEAAATLRSQMFFSHQGKSMGSVNSDDFTRGALSSHLSGPLSQRVRKELRYNYPEAL